jgi:tetratricopeptide (TPR) repeat protein
MDKNRILLDDQNIIEEELIEIRKETKSNIYKYLILGGLSLLILLILFSGLYYFYSKKTDILNFKKSLPDISSELKEKYYYPSKDITPALQKGINYYKEGFLEKAQKYFESLIDTTTINKEKIIAYTYLGIISLDLEKYPLAKHYFTQALKFDDSYLPAIVNLAITEYRLGNLEEAYQLAQKAKKIAPDDPVVAILTGNIIMNIKGAKEAEEEFRKGVESEPNEPVVRYNLAISLIRQGKTQEAILELQHFLQLFPNHSLTPNVLALLGQIYYSVDQYERALHYYKRAAGLAPDNAKIYYNIGVIYLKLKDESTAKEYFKKAMNLGSTDPEVFEKLSYAFEEFNDRDSAIKTMERSLQYNPDHIPSLFRLAELYEKNHNLLESAEIYRKIVNRTPGTEDTINALLNLGKVYNKMERYADSINVLQKAIELNPQPKIEVFYELGKSYYYGGRKDKAIEIWKLALDQPYITPEEKSKIHIILAKAYQNLGSYDLAIKELKKINIDEKNSSTVNLELGELYKNIKDYTTAVSYFLKVFDSIDSSIDQKKIAATQIAECYLFIGEPANIEIAKSWINKALRLSPEDPNIKLVKGKILLQSSSQRDIENVIETLLPLTYEDYPPSLLKEIYLVLGEAYFKNKEYQRALQSYQMVLQIDPLNEKAIKYKNIILQKMGE